MKEYALAAKVWFRESTNEWVLEITGEINDTSINTRHTAPASTDPADVPGLPHLYEKLEEIAAFRGEMIRERARSLCSANGMDPDFETYVGSDEFGSIREPNWKLFEDEATEEVDMVSGQTT